MQYWGTLSLELPAIEAEIPFHSEFRHALIVVVLNLVRLQGLKSFSAGKKEVWFSSSTTPSGKRDTTEKLE